MCNLIMYNVTRCNLIMCNVTRCNLIMCNVTRCDGHRSCSFLFNEQTFSNFCPLGNRKYVKIRYQCIGKRRTEGGNVQVCGGGGGMVGAVTSSLRARGFDPGQRTFINLIGPHS